MLDGLRGYWSECWLSLHYQKHLKKVVVHESGLYSYLMMSALLPRERRRKYDVHSAVRAVSTDADLCCLLNLAVYQSDSEVGSDKHLAVVTTKVLYCHEPAKNILSHL